MRFVLRIWSTPTVNAHSGTLKFFEHRSRLPSCSRLTTTWIGLAGSAVWCKPHLSCRSWMVIATDTTLVVSCLMILILSFKFISESRIRVVKIAPKERYFRIAPPEPKVADLSKNQRIWILVSRDWGFDSGPNLKKPWATRGALCRFLLLLRQK